jgi:hypothetical protein
MHNLQIETITPAMAEGYLGRNFNNRNLTKSHVAFLKSELLAGNYKLNGQSIVIGTTGRLLDGQHRLTAVVETGVPIQSVVMHNVDEEAFTTIDTGKQRGGCDALHIHGAKNSKHLASAIRKILDKFGSRRRTVGSDTHKIGNTEYVDFYKKNRGDLDALFELAHAWVLKGSRILSESEVMAYVYLMRVEDDSAYEFIEEVVTGEKKNFKSNAAQTLRKKLIDTRLSGLTARDTQKRDWVLLAFRKYYNDRNVSKIMVRSPFRFLEDV